MVRYVDNHTRDTYTLYSPDTKRVILTRNVKSEDWKMTDPEVTLKMFLKANKEGLVPDT